jgi:hypothetical protein
MDGMMKSMINGMSLEKKQEMMLSMMPMMMQDINMADTMIKMIPVMLDNVSLLDIFKVLKKLFPVLLKGVNSFGELIVKWDELMPQIMEKMLPVMQSVMPLMMSIVIPKMCSEKNMQYMKKMLENENVRKTLPQMMTRMMPHCLKEMYQYIDETEKEEFKETMISILT